MSKLFMTEKQISDLLKASRISERDHAIFHVALSTGFRASDLLTLTRKDVELPDGNICTSLKKKMHKTGKVVERKLSQSCRNALFFYLQSRTDYNPYLFPAQSNNTQGDMVPMNRSSLHRIYKAYLGMLFDSDALKGNACHITRRSVAQIIASKSGRIEPATRFLGHSSISSTIHYLDMDTYGKQADQIVDGLSWNCA